MAVLTVRCTSSGMLQEKQRTVSTAIGGAAAGQFIEGDRRADIIVRLPEHLRQSPSFLGDLPVPHGRRPNEDEVSRDATWSTGEPTYVPLREVARIDEREGPNQINRENGKRRVVVTANVRGRDLGGFVAELRERIDAKLVARVGYWIDYGGSFEQLISAGQRLAIVVPLALLIIFGLLFTAVGSARDAVADLHRRTVGVHWRRHRAVAARHSAIDLRGRRLHRAVRRGGAQRPGHARIHPPLRAEGLPLDEAVVNGAAGRLRACS